MKQSEIIEAMAREISACTKFGSHKSYHIAKSIHVTLTAKGLAIVPVEDKRTADAVRECKDDTWQCPSCGHSEPWWTESNADFSSRAMIAVEG